MSTVESLPAKWRAIAHELRYNPAALPATAQRLEDCADELEAALASQPNGGDLLALADEMERAFNSAEPIDLDAFADRLRTLASRRVTDEKDLDIGYGPMTDTVETILAEMLAWATGEGCFNDDPEGEPSPCVYWAQTPFLQILDRLAAAHAREVGELRAEISVRGDYVNERLLARAEAADALLREGVGGFGRVLIQTSDNAAALERVMADLAADDPRPGFAGTLEIRCANLLRAHGPALLEAVRDAERYRWLREFDVDSYLAVGKLEKLDAAIDAAMQGAGEVTTTEAGKHE